MDWSTRLEPFLARGGGVIFEDYSNLPDLGGRVTTAFYANCVTFATYLPVPGLSTGLSVQPLLTYVRFVMPSFDATLFHPFAMINADAASVFTETPGGGRMIVSGHDLDAHASFTAPNERDDYQLLTNELRWVSSGTAAVNAPPTVALPDAVAGVEGAPVAVTATASDADGDALTYAWDVDGDGVVDADGTTATFTFADDGEFVARVTVTDAHGATAAASTRIVVANLPPRASIVAAASEIASGELAGVTGSFTDAGLHDGPWTYEIEWPAGAPATGALATQSDVTARRQLLRAGTYEIRFTVADNDGAAGSASTTITVRRLPVPIRLKGGDGASPIQVGASAESDAKIPVFLLSTTSFDARQVDIASVRMGQTQNAVKKSGAFFTSVDDVNGDGRPDLVLHFERAALIANGDLTASTTALTLTADLADGRQIVAQVPVIVVP